MKGFSIKKWWLFPLAIVVLFIVLNPTYSDFQQYTGLYGDNTYYLHKRANYLVFSIYENEIHNDDRGRYIGILKNFYYY
jgi:hypothetical protein